MVLMSWWPSQEGQNSARKLDLSDPEAAESAPVGSICNPTISSTRLTQSWTTRSLFSDPYCSPVVTKAGAGERACCQHVPWSVLNAFWKRLTFWAGRLWPLLCKVHPGTWCLFCKWSYVLCALHGRDSKTLSKAAVSWSVAEFFVFYITSLDDLAPKFEDNAVGQMLCELSSDNLVENLGLKPLQPQRIQKVMKHLWARFMSHLSTSYCSVPVASLYTAADKETNNCAITHLHQVQGSVRSGFFRKSSHQHDV